MAFDFNLNFFEEIEELVKKEYSKSEIMKISTNGILEKKKVPF